MQQVPASGFAACLTRTGSWAPNRSSMVPTTSRLPLKSATSATTVTVLAIHGNPGALVSGNGTEFASCDLLEFCSQRSIELVRIPPHHPQLEDRRWKNKSIVQFYVHVTRFVSLCNTHCSSRSNMFIIYIWYISWNGCKKQGILIADAFAYIVNASFCYAARIPRLRVGTSVVSGYPINQYQESPYRRRRMNYMKRPPLDVLLRYIPQVEYPPEHFANTDDSEVLVNQQSPVNPPPASTTRSLSYPLPRPPQPLRKHSLHCSRLFSLHPCL